jgi:Mce-associated membrane protein
MDLAAVRSDGMSETETEIDAETVDAPVSPRPGGATLLVLTSLVLVALVVAAVLLGIRDHRRRENTDVTAGGASSAQQSALAAARGEAVALTTLDYQTAETDLNRVLAGATGPLRTQFEQEKNQLPATLAKTKSVSRGTVLSSALSSMSATRAQALVAVDATVSGSDTSATGVLKHYRMVVTLQQVDGKWLASDVAFAGVPQ